MTLKNNRASILYYIKLWASFQIHRWIRNEVTVWKRFIRVKIGDFLSRVTLKFVGWPWKNNRAPLLYYIKLCASFQSNGWIQTEVIVRKCSIWVKIGIFFVLCDLKIWWLTLENNRAPLLYYIKLCASFQSRGRILTGVTVRKRSIRVKIGNFFVPCDLEIWRMTLKNNRAPLLSYFKLCASFRSHWWIQTGVRVRNRPIWVKIDDFFSCVTLKFDGWPWKTIEHLF